MSVSEPLALGLDWICSHVSSEMVLMFGGMRYLMSSPLRSVPQPDSENTRAYKLDLKESSLYLPHAQRILGAYFQDQLILPGSYEDDTQLNTDFITRPSGIRI